MRLLRLQSHALFLTKYNVHRLYCIYNVNRLFLSNLISQSKFLFLSIYCTFYRKCTINSLIAILLRLLYSFYPSNNDTVYKRGTH